MKQPKWIDKYPGLQERMETLINHLALDREPATMLTNSTIMRKSKALNKKIQKAIDEYIDLETQSMKRRYAQLPSEDYLRPMEILNFKRECEEFKLKIIERLFQIERVHKEKDSRMSPNEVIITWIVKAAVESGLPLSKDNAHRYRALVKYVYANAGMPDPPKSLLVRVKTKVKYELQQEA